jgi:hypothetical protein
VPDSKKGSVDNQPRLDELIALIELNRLHLVATDFYRQPKVLE